jgi:hypothetical protein
MLAFLDNLGLTWFVLIGGLVLLYFFVLEPFLEALPLESVSFLFDLAPIWVPVILAGAFYRNWMAYIRMKWIFEEPHVVLEMKLPTEITQSPFAMEMVLNSLYHSRSKTIFDIYIHGVIDPVFALEIVSFEGKVRFFIWAERRQKELIEAQIYAHYPGVEVNEVEDYAYRFVYDAEKTMRLWGFNLRLRKPDPYPIRTYVDMGLDKEEKEEYKVDPVSTIVEVMGAIGKGEYMFVQFVVRAHLEKSRRLPGMLFKRGDWKDEAQLEVQKILKKTITPTDPTPNFIRLSPGDQTVIEAIQRSLNKKPFEVGGRAFYFAEREQYKGRIRNTTMPTMFRQFEFHVLNGLKPHFIATAFDYWWQDPTGLRIKMYKSRMFNAYRWRSWFYAPYKYKPFILNAEELATIYHFPGRVTQAPALERITSRRAEAPANIPT